MVKGWGCLRKNLLFVYFANGSKIDETNRIIATEEVVTQVTLKLTEK